MQKKPNFLFLFSDQHRGDWMPYDAAMRQELGTPDLHLNMPNIQKLMENGTIFTCAQTPSPLCAPARACLASGRRYRNCRVYTNNEDFDCRMPNFYRELNHAGYKVLGVGKFDLNKAELDWEDGFHKTLRDMGFTNARDNEGKYDAAMAAEQGIPGPYCRALEKAGLMQTYIDDIWSRKPNSDFPTPIPDEYYADNWLTDQGLEMLRDLPQDIPWFMQVNFSGPHNPWDITESMKEAVKDRTFPKAADCTFAEENSGVRQNYAAMIENIDRNIGKLIDLVKQRGELDHTIIIYAADHGEMLGDHNKYGKSTPERGSVHIPMVIDASYFAGKVGQINQHPVELQDLASTILDYAGCDTSKMEESVSLKPVIEGSTQAVRHHAISELIKKSPNGIINSFGTIQDGRYSLIMASEQKDRLYDHQTDPFEQHDIAEQNPQIVAALKEKFCNRKEV